MRLSSNGKTLYRAGLTKRFVSPFFSIFYVFLTRAINEQNLTRIYQKNLLLNFIMQGKTRGWFSARWFPSAVRRPWCARAGLPSAEKPPTVKKNQSFDTAIPAPLRLNICSSCSVNYASPQRLVLLYHNAIRLSTFFRGNRGKIPPSNNARPRRCNSKLPRLSSQ